MTGSKIVGQGSAVLLGFLLYGDADGGGVVHGLPQRSSHVRRQLSARDAQQ